MANDYIEGVGTTLSVDGSAYTGAELREVTLPEEVRESLETSHLGSAAKTFQPGQLKDGGEASMTLQYVPGENYTDDGLIHTYRYTLPLVGSQSTPGYVEFDGFVTTRGAPTLGKDQITEIPITLKVTGTVTHQPGS